MNEDRLDRELQFHVDQLAAKYIKQGMSEAEARRKARQEFGGMQQVKEECRDARGTLWIESTLQDIRFALRTLRKSPALAIAVIGTLALGIGANTAIFSVLNGVLLRSLPYPDPDRLIILSEGSKEASLLSAAYLNYLDWRRLTRTCEGLGAMRYSPFTLTGSGDTERLWGRLASASLFSVLRVTPVLGRTFRPEEDVPGGNRVVLISESLWTQRFSRDPGILGRTITLNGTAYTVVGVLPASFQFPIHFFNFPDDIAIPLGQDKDPVMKDRNFHPGISVIGRLKPGQTIQSAGAEFAQIGQALAAEYPKSNQGHNIMAAPLKDALVYQVRARLYVLMGAVAFVLLIACANVANLMLARSTARQAEIAMRIALGASRLRIVRQMLTESGVLAFAGGAAGLLLAAVGTNFLAKSAPGVLPRLQEIGVDGRVLAFSLATSLLTGLLFGLAPAIRYSRSDLRTSGRQIVSGSHRLRDLLVIGEVALALPLLVAGALMIRTIWKLQDVNPGFDPHNVVAMGISLSPAAASTVASIRRAYPELLARLSHLPTVDSAAAVLNLPMGNNDSSAPVWIESRPRPRSQSDMPSVLICPTTPAYLDVMRIPLLRGRFINDHDDATHPSVVVIDEVMARTLFPKKDPIGQRVWFGGPDEGLPSQIIGIVGHVKHNGLDDDVTATIRSQTYVPLIQMPAFFLNIAARDGTVVLRAKSNPMGLADAARAAITSIDPGDAVSNVRSMPEIVSGTLASRRFLLALLGTFASIALLLASVGIYGVISYSVSQRTREIGIRMALGAKRSDILKSIVGQGATLAVAGIAFGIIASFFLTRFISSLLFGVGNTDPITFSGVAIVLGLVAVLASLLPALRGSRSDPLAALRCE
ncbi:MAG: ADOP family duplicated permease [Bryobacteraceae bacterium]